MAKADQVKALIRSHADGDDRRFYSVAMQVAAHEARRGHNKLAEELRTLIEEVRSQSVAQARPTPLMQPRGELAGLLTVLYPKVDLNDLVLPTSLRRQLDRVLVEQRQREHLRHHGYEPISRLLLVGPPGTGKTFTASALAGELSLPLFTIQLHALMSKYLGETAAKLGLVFDAIAKTRGTYLFDEFDALGTERGAPNDVGEVRRVLNSFLQFLEAGHSDSLIIAATNHPQLLDRALFRRFDLVVAYNLPEPDLALTLLQRRLISLDVSKVDWDKTVKMLGGLSFAEIARAADAAGKNALLEGRTDLRSEDVKLALEERRVGVGGS